MPRRTRGSPIPRGVGRSAGAARHRQMGFESRRVVPLPFRGERPPVSLLLLAGSAGGNIPMRHFLDDRIFQTFIVFVEFYDPATPLPPHRIVFNAIGDADLAASGARRGAVGAGPDDGARDQCARGCRRDRAERHRAAARGHSGSDYAAAVTLPRTLLGGPDAATTLARHGFEFPFLIRTPGFHTGVTLFGSRRSRRCPRLWPSSPARI